MFFFSIPNATIVDEKDDDIPTLTAFGIKSGSLHPVSCQTRTMRRSDHNGDYFQFADGFHRAGSVDGRYDFMLQHLNTSFKFANNMHLTSSMLRCSQFICILENL